MSQDSQPGRGPASNPALDVLLDIELPVSLRFGGASLSLGEVMALTGGSLIEFNRALDDPVEVRVNGRVVAHGQVVTVQGNYGIKITEVANRLERLDTTSRLVPDGNRRSG
ncbi:MAG: FliM/FliN family flagellar motor switch protein [Bryobacteraceae bacterium]